MESRPAAMKVLVIDDCSLARQAMLEILTQENFEVATAADPLIAAEQMKTSPPDVIVLDLDMPRMDGLSFLRLILSETRIPIVVCCAVAVRGTEKALRALEAGAVDIVLKPQYGVRDFLYESAITLADAIRAAAGAKLHPETITSEPPRLRIAEEPEEGIGR